MRRSSCWAITSAIAVTFGLSIGTAGAATQYPVPYNFVANIVAEATQPGTPPPGSNNWSCTPTSAHPEPVVLVHGLLANMTDNWQTMSPLLANHGYCVFALTYGVQPNATPPFDQTGGLTKMERSAQQLSAFVDKVLAATHATKVDLVGHSEGATMPDYYLEYLGGGAKVHRYVGVSGVKHGTTVNGLGTGINVIRSAFPGSPDPTTGYCDSCSEFLVGSDYIHAIEARAPVRGVVYTNIATKYDELVTPPTNSFMRGANVTNILLQDHCALDFSEHLSIISSPITGQYILNALDPTHTAPVPCVPVLPVFGSGA
jgi:triacylglycerol esterase/lipase EstA (alpha/beta hydrolase family)